ncbi:MAG: thioredoxin family protein [Ferruginibacter sp.]|nr:thioredoxin family protein [Cytophagales bacterium]
MDSPINPTKVITNAHLAKAMSYSQYRALVDDLLREGKTTGPYQSARMTEYTDLNVHRMNRVEKTVSLNTEVTEALMNVSRNLIWVVLTEGWCGDAAQNLPVIAKIAIASGSKIDLKLLLRDENPEVMDAYLTSGGRSIPKLICLDADTREELGTWGPRPAVVQVLVMAHKADPQGVSHEQFIETIHAWYARDKSQHLQRELAECLVNWK